MNWTEEESERARQFFGNGKSLSQIAIILNEEFHQCAPVRNSNMVMGRIHRLRSKGATIRTPNTHPARNVGRKVGMTDEQRKQRIRECANAAAKRRREAKRKAKPAAVVVDFTLYRPRLSITDRESIPLELRAEPWHPLRDAKPAFLLRGRSWVR